MNGQYAKQKIIKDVKNDDTRIQITGYVKNIIDKDNFILDDNTGEIIVNTSNIDFKFKDKDLINVFGDLIIKVDGKKVINAEIIQNMNNLNFNYYIKLYELKKELNK